jgi:glycosyltransferase 2 family protein
MKVTGETRNLRRPVLVGLLAGVPLSGIFLYLAARNLEFGDVLATLGSADPARVALALPLMWAMYALQALRWRRITRREADLPTSRFLRYIVGGLACNNVVPGRLGDVMRIHWLARGGRIPHQRALGTVVVDRASDLLALVVLLAVTAPVAPRPAWLDRVDVVAAVGGLVLLVTLLAARRHARRRDPERSRSRVGTLVSDGLATMAHAVNRRDAPVVAGLSFAAWGMWSASAWLVASSVGISLTLPELLFVAAVVNLGVAIPSSPGFVGTYQWLCVATLGLLAVGAADAFAFLFHAVWYVPTTLAGLALVAARGTSVGLASFRPAQALKSGA